MKCYWCLDYFDSITSHFVMQNGQYLCPIHIGDSEKHLQPYVVSKNESAVDKAFESRTH